MTKPAKVALLWRGDRDARRTATAGNSRFASVFAALAELGIAAEPAVYDEETADEVRAHLLQVDAVLVWVNPLDEGRTRAALDALLRDVAAHGVRVSAHPDVILKMGTKEILHQTRDLGWGSDVRLYRTQEDFLAGFPASLRSAGPRVLKQNRGCNGYGVWKVEALDDGNVQVLHAERGSMPEILTLAAMMARCEPYFGWGGCILDQAFQPRLPEGMIRCYMAGDRVAGFGQQLIKALVTPPPGGPEEPGPRLMHPPSAPEFQRLRRLMETQWVPQMCARLDIVPADLPVIWDADFLYGPRAADGSDSYVLCEINVSSVWAIPGDAPAAIARVVASRLQRSAEPRGA